MTSKNTSSSESTDDHDDEEESQPGYPENPIVVDHLAVLPDNVNEIQQVDPDAPGVIRIRLNGQDHIFSRRNAQRAQKETLERCLEVMREIHEWLKDTIQREDLNYQQEAERINTPNQQCSPLLMEQRLQAITCVNLFITQLEELMELMVPLLRHPVHLDMQSLPTIRIPECLIFPVKFIGTFIALREYLLIDIHLHVLEEPPKDLIRWSRSMQLIWCAPRDTFLNMDYRFCYDPKKTRSFHKRVRPDIIALRENEQCPDPEDATFLQLIMMGLISFWKGRWYWNFPPDIFPYDWCRYPDAPYGGFPIYWHVGLLYPVEAYGNLYLIPNTELTLYVGRRVWRYGGAPPHQHFRYPNDRETANDLENIRRSHAANFREEFAF